MNLDFIAFPLGQLLYFIYSSLAFKDYGLAIIIFTIIIRLVMLPLTIKQYHSMSGMQEVQPQIQEIQKRFKNDKEKLNQELMKVYQEKNINPAGGCLPLLIQMPILITLYYVIQQPLKYMIQIGNTVKSLYPYDQIGMIDTTIRNLYAGIPKADQIANMMDLSILNYYGSHPDAMTNIQNILNSSNIISMNFLHTGLNLGLVPKWNPAEIFNSGALMPQYIALLLIPILAAATTFLQTKIMPQPSTGSGGTGDAMAASMQKNMMYMMPVMILFFSFGVPAGLGLYWIIGNVIQIFTQLYINKYVLKKKEVSKA